MDTYTIHIELDNINFFDLELESLEDFFIEVENDIVEELDFEQ